MSTNPTNPNEDGLTLDQWLKAVDWHLLAMSGMTAECLADYPTYDMWNDSVPPAEAAQVCLVEWNDFPEDLLGAVWEIGR